MSDAGRIRSLARPLRSAADLDPLLERIGDARFVLLGEASHGTADYYGWRAALTRRLVAERDVSFVAVEGDWPDCAEAASGLTDGGGAPIRPRSTSPFPVAAPGHLAFLAC